MSSAAFWWLCLNLTSILILAFYSMLEMACVSFNKVRLQYYVSKGVKRAEWLNYLLHNPSRLFGTTLIGVNVALVVGSECAREFHQAIGLDPDLAPLSQVIIVLIFGELAPMFAARHYVENVAMLGVPIVYFSAKILTPILWGLGVISKLCNQLIGGHETQPNIFLSQDELQKILEKHGDERSPATESEDFNTITTNIFNLSMKDASQVMDSISTVPVIAANATLEQMRAVLEKNPAAEYLPVYHLNISNIVGIAFPRDMLRIPGTRKVRDYARSPWFITQNTKVMQILKQFRRNNQIVAIVLNAKGIAVGVINLYDIIEEIFGKNPLSMPRKNNLKKQKQLFIERTFPGDMKISEFNTQFGVVLSDQGNLTFSELMIKTLGHYPEVGESIFLPPFEITVKKATLREIKTIGITTHLR